MAGCMSNLTILVRPKPKGIPTSDTVADLVHHWKKSNKQVMKSGESMLTILKLKFCSDHHFIKSKNEIETHCLKNTSKYTSYKIHKRCQWYRDLSIQIRPSIVRNLHLEVKKEQEEAEVM